MSKAKSLLTNQTANITGTAVIYDGRTEEATLTCAGVFGGASVQYQHNVANDQDLPILTDWVNIGSAITDNNSQRISLSYKTMLRALVTNASGTTNINCVINYQ